MDSPHLSTLLSQALVAFTIEADGEFESRMPHRTALSRAAGEKPSGPWLISLAMWANFLKYVGEDGIAVAALRERSGIGKVDTSGMTRWGYVTLADKHLRLTRSGAKAARIWSVIEDAVESRWRARFGGDVITSLRSQISATLADSEPVAPDYLPVVGYELWTMGQLHAHRDPAEQSDTLSAILTRALTAVAVAFERTSPVSLALAANVLRVLDPDGTPVREISARAGIAREITDVSLGYLTKERLATVTSDGRARFAIPSERGRAAQDGADIRLSELGVRFEESRSSLEQILSDRNGMVDTLTPHPMGWRASGSYSAQTARLLADPRAALPHFPIVTHRGGYPDGS